MNGEPPATVRLVSLKVLKCLYIGLKSLKSNRAPKDISRIKQNVECGMGKLNYFEKLTTLTAFPVLPNP